MIKRIFPTQLKVVESVDALNAEEEGRRGYYDPNGKQVVDIAIRAPNQVYITSPGWYKSYTFTINVEELQAHQQKQQQQQPQNQQSDDDDVVPPNRVNALWKLIAIVVKTECGRRALYMEGARHIRVTNLAKNHAKQIYYLMKHVLMRMGVSYTLTPSWIAPSFAKTEIPDIRERTKRRRKRKAEVELLASAVNGWRTVGRGPTLEF